MNPVLTIQADHLVLRVRVQPKSSKTVWGDVINGEYIKLRITAPPVDGAANKACIKFLSKTFGAAKSRIKILQGEKNRLKVFQINEMDTEKLRAFQAKYLSESDASAK